MLFLVYLSLNLLHCFSELRAPPITLTKTLTAAEKQMIGEDKELEKNGWVIASIKSSSTGAEDWRNFQEESTNQTELEESKKILVYSSFEIYRLKKEGILGESLSGNLEFVNLPKDLPDKERLESLVKLTNQARNKLREIQVSSNKPKLSTEELKKLEQNLKLEYWRTVEHGMFFEESKGVWKKKM